MNIFILDQDPVIAASYLCDQHIHKMILESAQMLSTCSAVLTGTPSPRIYKSSHINHPCNIWVRKSYGNILWLYRHAKAMETERNLRGFNMHQSIPILETAMDMLTDIPHVSVELTPFTLAMPDEYKHPDPVKAYRDYYKGKKEAWEDKSKKMTWFNGPPDWMALDTPTPTI